MPVAGYAGLRSHQRERVRDEYSTEWSDPVQDGIIDESKREYSLYTCKLTGQTTIVSTGGVISAPADLIYPLTAVDPDGYEQEIQTWKKLVLACGGRDFRDETGSHAESLCFDFDGYGKYRVFPNVPSGQTIGTLHYVRFSHDGEMDVPDEELLEEYALYLMLSYLGKETASAHQQKFLKQADSVRGSDAIRNRKTNRGGRFF